MNLCNQFWLIGINRKYKSKMDVYVCSKMTECKRCYAKDHVGNCLKTISGWLSPLRFPHPSYQTSSYGSKQDLSGFPDVTGDIPSLLTPSPTSCIWPVSHYPEQGFHLDTTPNGKLCKESGSWWLSGNVPYILGLYLVPITVRWCSISI